ncbi:hypothetical protein AALP_AA4G041400 [Arabis alpina]|uniref:non-specific serine/threonine protein kinase n=1 Tax=Arabis alpina TaxID=50452 RepID=A0A087H115_ARAAL|nr:hypothetical protein AALP_AA4G041400 [Arabis alpina]
MQIAMEAAQGLEYLHNGSIPPMVHRDVKTTNILLNELFHAKLADFGLSRSSPVDGESYESTLVAGTPGYLDPEYYRTNLLSEKSDVYSFGVVLLEIVTNQPVIDKNRKKPHITEWVRFMLMEGDIRNVIDPKIMGEFDTNGVWKALELAMACVSLNSNRRPTMPYVVMELRECLDFEIARKQGSQVTYYKDSVEFSLSPTSDFSPEPRELVGEDINEAVSSLVFASSRCGELPELISIRELFNQRYGRNYITKNLELLHGNLVNFQIKEKLSITSISEDLKFKLLEEIAKESGLRLEMLRLEYTPEIEKQVNEEEEKKAIDSDLNNSSEIEKQLNEEEEKKVMDSEVYKFSLTDVEGEKSKEEDISMEDDYIEETKVGKDQRVFRFKESSEEERSSSSLSLLSRGFKDMESSSGSLIAFARVFFSPTPSFIRYDEDLHDRIWIPYVDNKTLSIKTDVSVDTSNLYNVPQPMARTAAIPTNPNEPLTIDWTLDEITAQSYIYMHFAEIQNLEANETREFNITYNGGQNWYNYFTPPKFSIITIYNPTAVSSIDGKFTFTFSMTGNSTRPPLINGLEIYKVLDLTLLETSQDEVFAMMSIKKTYGLSKRSSWQGDPCAPEFCRWEGLNCSYQNFEPPQIISLNLSGSNLNGNIASEIFSLTHLTELDLSNNGLSGEIPDFLGKMKSLKLINIRGNPNLNVSVPVSVQENIDNKSLILIRDETEKKNDTKILVVAITSSVAGVFALLVIAAITFVVARRKQKTNEVSGPVSITTSTVKSETKSSSNASIITKERKFTYSEVLKMTNNFERVLGKGGFGTVYHGNLDDTQVAVKMLSHSSSQGYKEFKAEVELLLRVHHRHLVGLVGYCDDGDKLALIYEYMENGDLRENLLGKRRGNVLSWETRLQIAVEAAQGLEYLHNGCRPPMVHRDVKPTNILLNERSQAKLADFGLSRSFPVDGESHVMTVVAGTPGYLDPEYYRTNWLSEKSDVYSFGIVLLEIVTNQPVINKNREKSHITEWVGFMLTNGDIKRIVDPKLMDDYDTNGVWKVVELALACVNPSSNRRPTMPHVVMELNECLISEIERKRGSQEMYSKDPTEFSPSFVSDFVPRARYDEDINDRVWYPFSDGESTTISTDQQVVTSNFFEVPQVVMQTAGVPKNTKVPWSFGWTLDNITAQSYIYMHFAELQNLKANEIREFIITYNGGKLWYGPFRPPKLSISTIYNPSPFVSSSNGEYNFTFTMTGNSTLPPLIQALEIYTILDMLELETDKDEVSAMMNIKKTYSLSKKISWQGDPCAPQIYLWEAPRAPSATPGIAKSETRSSNPSIISKDRRIAYPEVLKMTNNFERVLGKGGFGTVYHGNLDDAQVAVKMLSHSSAQGYKEFKAEVELLLRVHHRHLVGLVGYCDDGDNLALIYEYMANGDLRENMSGKGGGNILTWENRMQIAVEAAQGLEYLHDGCTPPMVHRDVKTTNILLNERSGAKLADFGLSRSFPIDGECHVSTVVAGTPGYLDPEYYRTNWLSETSDVYSFGVVLLEIVTNQPVIDKNRERTHINEWVGVMLSKGDIKNIVDPKLMGDYDTNGAWKIVELALSCVNPSSSRRPTMAHVVMELKECVALENARRQGFISLDCGLVPKDTNYVEKTTNVTYKSDADYIDSGLIGKINDAHKTTLVEQHLWALRSFPEDGKFNFTLAMTGNSTLPPLMQALEIYTVVDILQLETDKDEVSAMMSIKKTYSLSKKFSWQGDPCAPQFYVWEGLNCSYSNSNASQIISLNLKESELTGTITSDISKLTHLDESQNKKESKKVPMVAIGASVAGVFALLVILAIFFFVRRKKGKSTDAPTPPSVTPGIVKSETRSSNPSIISKDRRITYPEILKMTNNFDRVLGKGGFGTVYHGNLDDAQVAVKMLSHSSAQGYKEFKAEVELLLRVHHRHLVGLVGYCDDGDNLALIYEYMANGDLKENMSGKGGGNVLTWENRMQIAVEAAQGLEYLHNGCRPPMVHRDVKTTNILLNERSQAKLADFGLSRSFPIDGECHVSTVVAGTPGYLDPDYYRTNWLSEKSDVYSYGVVLLEIVTNQPVIDKTRVRPHINEWVGFMLTKGDIKNIVDPKLMGDYDTNGAWKIVELALSCVNPSSNRRPTMAHVVMELNECAALENARRQAQDPTGFINVDCGLSSREPPYIASPTGLSYTSDAGLVNTGLTEGVMSTGAIPLNANETLNITWTMEPPNAQFYSYMHFSEIQTLRANDTREFNVTLNGNYSYGPYSPKPLKTETVLDVRPEKCEGGACILQLVRTPRSTLPPLLNAIEAFTVIEFPQMETNGDEVFGIKNVQSTYGLSKINWQGDPCVPKQFMWDGLNCNNSDISTPPIITSLDLSASGLTGIITQAIQNLTHLQKLDLSNNNLTGEIPGFLADIKSLLDLDLSGNNFTGSVPPSLLQKKGMKLSVEGNPHLLCGVGPCDNKGDNGHKKKSIIVPIVASIASIAILIVALALFFVLRKKKPSKVEEPTPSYMQASDGRSPRSSEPAIMTKNRRFTYSEVVTMTNNFQRVLGKGGFGIVYHGFVNGTEQVAVKKLSHSSSQGYKQFKAEVELLLRVHHKNLVGLVGYCDEGENLALIYEYMANGDLKEHMSGTRNRLILNWGTRLKIVLESAQGLEYLHNGCKPPMVHRDVKTTNILLNEHFQAKLADFGLSRSFPIEGETHVSTVVAGTPGYLDPEYYRTNWLTEKSDVYSFGIVLLEIITNQPVINQNREKPHIGEWVGVMLTKGDIKNIMDPTLNGDYDSGSVWKAVELAMGCLNPSSAKRPTMSQVVIELNECLASENSRGGASRDMDSKSSIEVSLTYGTEMSPVAR